MIWCNLIYHSMEKMSDLVEKRVDVSCLRFVLLFLIKLELKETSKKYVLIIYLNFFLYEQWLGAQKRDANIQTGKQVSPHRRSVLIFLKNWGWRKTKELKKLDKLTNYCLETYWGFVLSSTRFEFNVTVYKRILKEKYKIN